MAHPKDVDPMRSPRAFYGSELRRLREAAGLSQEKLGEMVICSGAYIGQIESAVRKPQLDMSVRLDAVFGTDGLLARLCVLANKSKHADYFAEASDLEALAVAIHEYAPTLIPGVLQTEAYARAVILAAQPLASEESVRERLAARIERSRVLANPTRPLLWVILDENVLRRPIGGPNVMHEQLLHVIGLVERRRIIVQVIPIAHGAHSLMEGVLSLMAFDDAPQVAYVEGLHAGQLLDDPSSLAKCQLSYDLGRAVALPPEASLSMLRSAAEEYLR
ncbi:helix-turn-helix domain-containing protein [Streptodolium elevatio]|uniref:Helix-turn-helix transcriptional regulator n=1 Tax=Streptodolium elevatio TaxID=3157996 RepID=A0ABV3DVC2_9ACTN